MAQKKATKKSTAKRRKAPPTPKPDPEPEAPEETWKCVARCPECQRPPAVRFARSEVDRARRERQSAHVQSHQCSKCGTLYWIMARDIAAAVRDAA